MNRSKIILSTEFNVNWVNKLPNDRRENQSVGFYDNTKVAFQLLIKKSDYQNGDSQRVSEAILNQVKELIRSFERKKYWRVSKLN